MYVEVLGTLVRRVGVELAEKAKAELDRVVNPLLTVACNREFCLKAYALCHEYNVYAVDSFILSFFVFFCLDGRGPTWFS